MPKNKDNKGRNNINKKDHQLKTNASVSNNNAENSTADKTENKAKNKVKN